MNKKGIEIFYKNLKENYSILQISNNDVELNVESV